MTPEGLEPPQLAWEIIQRAKNSNVPFEAVDMDDLNGRNTVLRRCLDEEQIEYYGDLSSRYALAATFYSRGCRSGCEALGQSYSLSKISFA